MELQVEVARPVGSEETGRGEMVRDAVTDAFERAQDAIVAVATSTVGTIARLGEQGQRPDEVQVTFGLKFSANGSVIIAGVSTEATLEVALTYRAAAEPHPDGA
ncbi:CU044_2847 family protein [Plantactinospora sp. B6F1]|uniref:CU044_2847 family protein n=1 Tax=Plantactinospora sp. B6F1 TaxID=3158971 RepID=UPI0032D90309